MKQVERSGDMGQGLKLRLFKDNQGDVHVSILKIDQKITRDSVAFCNSGTHSHRTLVALYALFKAMEEDERELPDFNLGKHKQLNGEE